VQADVTMVREYSWYEDFQLRQENLTQFYPDREMLQLSTAYTYSSEGNRQIMVATFSPPDGAAPLVSTVISIRQDDILTVDRYSDVDDIPFETYTLTFNEDGLPVKEMRTRADILVSLGTTSWDYDLQGNRIRQYADFQSDGVADSVTEFFYDADGVLLRSENRDGVGVLQRTTEYEYDGREIWWSLENSLNMGVPAIVNR
jgi:hypothetical protein